MNRDLVKLLAIAALIIGGVIVDAVLWPNHPLP